MGYVANSGYLLIGCCPAMVFFATRIAHRSFLVVLTITSCAIWMLSALLLALPWIHFLPLGSSVKYVAPLIICVSCHEACGRASWLPRSKWTTDALETLARHFGYRRVSGCDQMSMRLAWGFGQGIARGILFFASNGFLAQGPGTYYIGSCSHMPFFLATAFSSLAFIVIHTSDTLAICDHEPDSSSHYFVASATQTCACFLTLGNLYSGGCVIVVPTLVALAMVLMSHAATTFLLKTTVR
mmetsp:Transcript_7003/g.17878  ORF Transcript_7003/g.17878 Transcript_7003/m.17878 type:complete len:241 (-) Transcript_7003:506-1228(-)